MDAVNCSEISEADFSPQIELCCNGFNEYRKAGKFVDLTLILPNKSEFKVHKSILALRCSYFEAMFDYNELSRKNEVINSQQENNNENNENCGDDDNNNNENNENCGDDDNHGTNESTLKDDIVKLDRRNISAISADIFKKIIDFIYYLVRTILLSNILLDEISGTNEIVNLQEENDNENNNCTDNDNTSSTNENVFEDDIVKLDRDISADIFEKIIDFIYTGDIKISAETALILHENAIYFNLTRLKEICAEFLTKTFEIGTCLVCWRKAACDDNLKEKCFEFIVRNCELFLERYILTLTFVEIKKIISSNKAVCPEGRLYGFVIQWVTNDYENRSEQFKLLLEDLRFIALTKNDCLKFNMIFNDNISNKELVLAVLNNFKQKANDVTAKSKTNQSYQLSPPRIGFREKHFVTVTPKSIYNHELNTWTLVNKHNFNEGFNVNTFGLNYLLFSGGGEDAETSKNCEFYCPILNSFKAFPAMRYKRNLHGILSLNNKIYACGGKFSNTMEIFDLNSGIWIEGPSTIQYHSDFGMVSYDNCVYVTGGGQSSIVERFDPRQNIWNTINNYTPEVFKKTRSVCLDQKLYCFTSNGINILDLRLNKWLTKIQLPELSSNSKLTQRCLIPELSISMVPQSEQPGLSNNNSLIRIQDLSIKLPQNGIPELSNNKYRYRLYDFDVTVKDNDIYVFCNTSMNCNIYKYNFDSTNLTELPNLCTKSEDYGIIRSISISI